MKHPSGSGFDIGWVCFTCGNNQPTCKPDHDIRRCHLFDASGRDRKADAEALRIARAREIEDRILGERDAA